MAAGVAHDLNNLLAAILGNISVVLNGLPSASPLRGSAKQVEEATLRAAELSGQLMTCAGRGRVHPEEVDPAALVRGLGRSLEDLVGRNILLELRIADPLPALRADPRQVATVLRNLVANSADALDDREGTITVSVSAERCDRRSFADACYAANRKPDNYVCMEVADTGCGIGPGIQCRVFDPFFTTKLRGRGLGLSLVLGIVIAHGGAIRIRSQPGRGTAVSVYFACRGPQDGAC
jgi:signal transduction histidine kinase